MDSVVHFEMPHENRERMAEFYRSAFGWQSQVLGPDMGGYVVVTTTETGESGSKKPGAINGGFSFLDSEGNRVSPLQPLPRR